MTDEIIEYNTSELWPLGVLLIFTGVALLLFGFVWPPLVDTYGQVGQAKGTGIAGVVLGSLFTTQSLHDRKRYSHERT